MVDRLTCCKNQVRLLEQINKELDVELGEALDTIQKLQSKIDQLIGKKEYIPTERTSYPYTHPIRDIPDHSKVKK